MSVGARHDEDSGVLTRAKKPKLYKVILLNDNYTTMEFVVYVLQKYVQKGEHEARKIMLDVHNNGSDVAGVDPREIAETKSKQVMAHAEQEGFPPERPTMLHGDITARMTSVMPETNAVALQALSSNRP